MKKLLFGLILVFSGFALAHGEHEKAAMPKEFDQLKTLVGEWEGSAKMMGDTDEPVKIKYDLNSGDTILVENLFPGTKHSMMSVYHAEKNKLAMTHYCMMGNEPKMSLKKVSGNVFSFEMVGTEGIGSKNEPHMHALTLTILDSDHIKHEWTMYSEGKKKEVKVFNLTRSKALAKSN